MSKDNKTKQELQCEIVQDILPLYHDGVVSDVTHKAVSEHLEGCETCSMEYEYLCEELPQEIEKNDDKSVIKSKFEGMKKKFKKKNIVMIALVSLVICTVMIIAGYVLTRVPLVEISDDTILVRAVYRIETQEGPKIFFAYNDPPYEATISFGAEIVESSETGVTLSANCKRPILSKVSYIQPSVNFDLYSVEENVETVTFGGKVVWTEKENGKDEVPEYVYEYANPNSWKNIYIGPLYVEMMSDDGRLVLWDYNGNMIYEGEESNIIDEKIIDEEE